MLTAFIPILAGFTAPEQIGINPHSTLWLLPLAAAVAIIYKATKTPTIKMRDFLKEVVILFCSIVVVLVLLALALYALAWLITQ